MDEIISKAESDEIPAEIIRKRVVDEIIRIAFDPNTKESEKLRALNILLELDGNYSRERETQRRLDEIFALLRNG